MATKLDTKAITDICIRRASGMKQVDLAKEYEVSPDTIRRVERNHTRVMTLFVEDTDGKYKLNTNFSGPDNKPGFVSTLSVRECFVCDRLEITGDPNDGILIIGALWERNDGSDTDYPLSDLEFGETDVGIVKVVKVGEVKVHDGASEDTYEAYEDRKFDFEKHPTAKKTKAIPGHEAPYFAASVKLTRTLKKPVEFVWNASNKFISITRGREVWNASNEHPNFASALNALSVGQFEKAVELIVIERAVKRYVKGNITIENGSLFYKNINLKNGIAQRIIKSMNAGEDFEFYLPFLENLMLNPSERAVNRLFDFLEANDIEITTDGHFYAWKKVAEDYKDIYTGEYDNTPNGKNPPRMDRNQVDEDDTTTCSRGLHVCSKSYLSQYGSWSNGARVVKCKVHPQDVVAIPRDYKNAKMRTCGYVVVEDVTGQI